MHIRIEKIQKILDNYKNYLNLEIVSLEKKENHPYTYILIIEFDHWLEDERYREKDDYIINTIERLYHCRETIEFNI